MANLVDLYIVYRILRILTTPYENWEAYKTGVIDKNGKIIVKRSSRSQEQKDSYTKFDNLMLKLKNKTCIICRRFTSFKRARYSYRRKY